MRRKDIDEMDLSFEELNKKPIGVIIFFILLLFVVIGGCCYYYFVIDSPKTIFLTSINNILEKVNINDPDKDIDYKLELNMISNNEEDDETVKTYLNILNELSIEGYHRKNNNTYQESMIINYKDKLLLDLSLLEQEENTYIKLNNLYDKVINFKLDELITKTEENSEEEIEISIEDYKIIIDRFIKNFTEVMKSANYKKIYTKLNDEYVKKVTLLCDKEFNSLVYDKLIHDEEFIKSYAKIESKSEEEIIDSFNEEISLLEDSIEEISIYLTILDNKFIMFEDKTISDYFKVEKLDNKYYYEYTEENNLLFKGYIEYKNNNDSHYLTLSYEDTEEKIIIKSDIEYTLDTKDIELIDTSNSIKYEEITEPDLIKIMENLGKNEAFNLLIEDTGLLSNINGVNNQQI